MKNTMESDRKKGGFRLTLERLSLASTEWAGGAWAFAVAGAFVLAWAVTGPVFHFSDSWQVVINTVTSIVTFLMVFLIQRAQNKDSKAIVPHERVGANSIPRGVRETRDAMRCPPNFFDGRLLAFRKVEPPASAWEATT